MKETKKWRSLVAVLARPHRPDRPLMRAKVTYTRHSSRRPDQDNLTSTFKPLQDGLVDAGIIIDDSYRVIGVPLVLHESAKPRGGMITIRVESV